MQFNPFGHIKTENFIHHSLGQRFKDAWKVLGLQNPFDFAKSNQAFRLALDGKIGEVLIQVKDDMHFGLLSYVLLVPSILLGIGIFFAALPGAIFLGLGITADEELPVRKAMFLGLGILLLAPVGIGALLAVVGSLLAMYTAGAILLAAASPFILLAHLGCNIAACFSPSVDSQPYQTLDSSEEKPYTPSYNVVGDTLGHDARTAAKAVNDGEMKQDEDEKREEKDKKEENVAVISADADKATDAKKDEEKEDEEKENETKKFVA